MIPCINEYTRILNQIVEVKALEQHMIAPIFCKNSKVLILGSFPSVKSREVKFFYGNPKNRFWRVMAEILGRPVPLSVEEKTAMLRDSGIALWDVIASCDIDGSDDSSIKNVVPNDLRIITENAGIKRIFTNGGKADKLYRAYCLQITGITATRLPSTSPANAGSSFEKLVTAWKAVAESLL